MKMGIAIGLALGMGLAIACSSVKTKRMVADACEKIHERMCPRECSDTSSAADSVSEMQN